MMHVSKTAGYAIHALSCIGNARSHTCFVRNIAARTGLQKPYLSKIINQLAHDGLVVAKRGYRGGVALARPPEAISLLQIVTAVDGEAWTGPCLFGLDKCCPAKGRCPAHDHWNEIRGQIAALLSATTLADVMKTSPARKTSSAKRQ